MPGMNGLPPIVLRSRRIDPVALRCPLLFSPATVRQIPFVLGEGPATS
jgi:hypothetical protein